MAMTIKTNNVPRELLSGWELTQEERLELDYIADEDDNESWGNEVNRFFRYNGDIYDTNEFVRIVPRSQCVGFEHGVEPDSPLLKWDGIQTDSFFSGIVIRYCEGYESVVVGLALS